jgi:hypothetical protein
LIEYLKDEDINEYLVSFTQDYLRQEDFEETESVKRKFEEMNEEEEETEDSSKIIKKRKLSNCYIPVELEKRKKDLNSFFDKININEFSEDRVCFFETLKKNINIVCSNSNNEVLIFVYLKIFSQFPSLIFDNLKEYFVKTYLSKFNEDNILFCERLLSLFQYFQSQNCIGLLECAFNQFIVLLKKLLQSKNEKLTDIKIKSIRVISQFPVNSFTFEREQMIRMALHTNDLLKETIECLPSFIEKSMFKDFIKNDLFILLK